MTAMGVSRLMVSKLLNHDESGVTAIYGRHSYDAEKSSVLELWIKRLQEIINGIESKNNVILLPRAV